jgi:hypothetical protein
MTATFLVEVEVDGIDPVSLQTTTEDIADACESAGLLVSSVKPWSRPTSAPMGITPAQGGAL